jgi:uncharacterized protein YcbK (DUF882 family)
MQFKSKVVALAAISAVSVGLGPHSKASSLRTTKIGSIRTTEPKPVPSMASEPEYRLHLHHLHTGEDIDIVYRIGNSYLPDALGQLNHFLRDHRTQDVSDYDPKEFDVLHELMSSLGKSNGVIDIVCGFRTPSSNNFLRTRSTNTGVAEHSQHMLAKAIDIRVPGVNTLTLRNAALALHAGGVGFYPVSQFVHVDVGPVRQWAYR